MGSEDRAGVEVNAIGQYDRAFFRRLDAPAIESARVVAPLVLKLIQPKSVVDIGCGTGGWLSVFHELGVDEFIGVDGDYVDRRQLRIPPERFVAADLRRPFAIDRRFDLVVCLEVAEHLPAAVADDLVGMLTALGSVILFSAAIPFQGGTGHVNEQWPDYWRALFGARDYVLIDCLRRRVWEEPNVQPYIAQNIVLYVASGLLATSGALREEQASMASLPLRLVHPGVYQVPSVRRLLRLLRHAQNRSAAH